MKKMWKKLRNLSRTGSARFNKSVDVEKKNWKYLDSNYENFSFADYICSKNELEYGIMNLFWAEEALPFNPCF